MCVVTPWYSADEPDSLKKQRSPRGREMAPRVQDLEPRPLACEEVEASGGDPAQVGSDGEEQGDLPAAGAPELCPPHAAEVEADPRQAEEAALPIAPGNASSRPVVAEQGVGPRPHLEGPGGSEHAAEEEAEVTGSAKGERREGGGHDV